jgi:hypothetical protein
MEAMKEAQSSTAKMAAKGLVLRLQSMKEDVRLITALRKLADTHVSHLEDELHGDASDGSGGGENGGGGRAAAPYSISGQLGGPSGIQGAGNLSDDETKEVVMVAAPNMGPDGSGGFTFPVFERILQLSKEAKNMVIATDVRMSNSNPDDKEYWDQEQSCYKRWCDASSAAAKEEVVQELLTLLRRTRWFAGECAAIKSTIKVYCQQKKALLLVCIEGGPFTNATIREVPRLREEAMTELRNLGVFTPSIEICNLRTFQDFEQLVKRESLLEMHKEVEDHSTLGGIVAGLAALQSEYKDGRLLELIQKLQGSGGNLWEVEHKEMAEMPTWLQEQNRAYTQKKENVSYLQKHRSAKQEACRVRGDSAWSIGDRVEVTKPGSYTGQTAVVVIPNWEGRIMVRMDSAQGAKKSYMANEIKKISTTHVKETTEESRLIVAADEWGFDVLKLSASLLVHTRVQKESSGPGAPGVGGVLSTLGGYLFSSLDLSQNFGVEERAMLGFLRTIEGLYVTNPYHNAMHGADCMRTIHYFITASDLGKHLTPLESFAGLFAGAIHDVQVGRTR